MSFASRGVQSRTTESAGRRRVTEIAAVVFGTATAALVAVIGALFHGVRLAQWDQAANAWLSERLLSQGFIAKGPASGVPAAGGDRAETPLLDLVRTGIENDFERVVFPEYPELREVKSVLQREGARYASLSGSGSTLYGMFDSASEAIAAAERMGAAGHAAVATRTVGRAEYWEQLVVTRNS